MKQTDIDMNKNSENQKYIASMAHILGLIFGVIGPLLIYVFSNDEFVKENALRSISWQLFFTGYFMLSFILLFTGIGLIFLPIIFVLDIAFAVSAAIKAKNGNAWKYPLTTDLFVNSQDNKSKNVRQVDTGKEEKKSQEKRISELKNMYVNGEISEEEFDRLVDIELDNKDRNNNPRKSVDKSLDKNYK